MAQVTQIKKKISLHGIVDELEKIHYGVLYLDPKWWKWCEWHTISCQGYVAWTQFFSKLNEHFDTDTHHLGHLAKLKYFGTMEYFITAFEHLAFKMDGMLYYFFRE
jgi:hypothetical protein